jgi:hypothetical protein
MVLNALCSVRSELNTDFPCNINAITAVSLGIGAGACALIFVLYLLREVRLELKCIVLHSVVSFSAQ